MILNKFRPVSYYRMLRVFSLQLMAVGLFCCNKSANSNANKAFVALTHVAYRVDPLNLALNGDSLLSSPVSFGNTSGQQGYPYDTATSRISEMQLVEHDVLLSGNAAFQQGAHYSVFAYDSLDKQSIALLILQDNPSAPTDSSSSFRFLNFSPGSRIGLIMWFKYDATIQDTIHISVRDTTVIGLSNFVGYNPSPASYPFGYYGHYGENKVFAYVDSAKPRSPTDSTNIKYLGTLQFDTLKSYNIFLQGYFYPGPGQDSLQLKHIQLD